MLYYAFLTSLLFQSHMMIYVVCDDIYDVMTWCDDDDDYQQACPLYTVFIALQDITPAMGPTLFLPNTNNEHDHSQHKSKNQTLKNTFLAKCVYKQGLLRKGDAVIMDSRTMHCGTGNSSGKRVLLYFTLNNPHFTETPPPTGSKFADLELNVEGLRQ